MFDVQADLFTSSFSQLHIDTQNKPSNLIELHGYIQKNCVADGSSLFSSQTRVTFEGYDDPKFQVRTRGSGGIPIRLVAPDNSTEIVYLDKTSLEKRFPKVKASEFPHMMRNSQTLQSVEELHATISQIAPTISEKQLRNALIATKHINRNSPDQKISRREYNRNNPTRPIPRNILCMNGKPYLQLNHENEGDKIIANTPMKQVRYCLGLHDNKLYTVISTYEGLGDDLIAEVPRLQEMRGCPNIVQAHGDIIASTHKKVDASKHYLIETLYEGGTLSGLIDDSKKLRIAKKLTKSMAAMHKKGIIHRDLKPDNIFLDAQGEPYIGDLGTACRLTGDDNRNVRTGGTLPYMAPEFARAHSSLPRSTTTQDFQTMVDLPLDVYGMGCVLYELFIQPVQSNRKFPDLQSQHRNTQLQHLGAMNEDWMAEPNAKGTHEERRNHIIWSMLRADPAKRITADQVSARFAAL